MIFTIKIYTYAIILVIGSVFKLKKAKKLFQLPSTIDARKEIFETPQKVSKKVIKATGSDVRVTGREKIPEGPVLYVANHQGLFDILVFLGHLGKPIGFIAKKEINKLPIIRTWMGLIKCVFIDRSDRRQSMKAINQGIENLKSGYSLVVFPEGTRSEGAKVNEFKPGSLRLATKADVPIIPITINGTYHMLEGNDGMVNGSTISMTIHDPIHPESYKALKSTELAKLLKDTVESALPVTEDTKQIPEEELVVNSL